MSKLLLCSGSAAALLVASVACADDYQPKPMDCQKNSALCTEVSESIGYEGTYTGHDEPSVLFYSNTPGSGNSSIYRMKIPLDPPTLPTQNGKGGTFNFQLHPAFWFGMAMCDSQSAPNFTHACTPNTDDNIFDSADPASPKYIGKHPGTAFMEMQFYPPGWALWPAGNSCDGTRWCAALTIDSLGENQNTAQVNNANCLDSAGLESVNFAFITKNGVPLGPPGPLTQTLATFTVDPTKVLLMNPGDEVLVVMSDTGHGLGVTITDTTTGESGSMVASAANGFAQVVFNPTATTCTQNLYDFRPMYSTSSEHTRVPWAAHTYNIAFSDEIGHWEYCNQIQTDFLVGLTPVGHCTQAGVTGPDDTFCLNAASSSRVQVSGCTNTDNDFDGLSYQLVWPGTLTVPGQDKLVHPTPVQFTSPLFIADGKNQNYDRVAFETDLPRIESTCNRSTGVGCVNPPSGAAFYPFFSATNDPSQCFWMLGGDNLNNAKQDFGGSSSAEFGALLQVVYPGPVARYNDFRQVLSNNPCPHNGDSQVGQH